MDDSIGEFLRSRRAPVAPEQVGLSSGVGRRVPDLRREELAYLAGVSVDYYVRLELGRTTNVSDAVLDAIARALDLTADERERLINLARPRHRRIRRPGEQSISRTLRRLLDMMDTVPVLVLSRRMDILAWNNLADAVFGVQTMIARDRNAARAAFLNPHARALYPNWDSIAAEAVAQLRLEAGRYPDDPQLAALVGELATSSNDFRYLWAQNDVKRKTTGVTHIAHPVVGALEFTYQTLSVPMWPEQVMVAFTVEPNSPSQERLRLLCGRAPNIDLGVVPEA